MLSVWKPNPNASSLSLLHTLTPLPSLCSTRNPNASFISRNPPFFTKLTLSFLTLTLASVIATSTQGFNTINRLFWFVLAHPKLYLQNLLFKIVCNLSLFLISEANIVYGFAAVINLICCLWCNAIVRSFFLHKKMLLLFSLLTLGSVKPPH